MANDTTFYIPLQFACLRISFSKYAAHTSRMKEMIFILKMKTYAKRSLLVAQVLPVQQPDMRNDVRREIKF